MPIDTGVLHSAFFATSPEATLPSGLKIAASAEPCVRRVCVNRAEGRNPWSRFQNDLAAPTVKP